MTTETVIERLPGRYAPLAPSMDTKPRARAPGPRRRVREEEAQRTEHRAPQTSICDLLLRAAQMHADCGLRMFRAERDEEGTFLGYPALLDTAQRVLGGLRGLGLSPGTKVVLLLERTGDLLPAFWACVLGG